MELIGNFFQNNSALTINKMEGSGNGGAIYFECPNNNCVVKLI